MAVVRNFDASEFKRRLSKLPAKVKREVNKAIEKDAREWVSLADTLAPKDPTDGTFLAPSIRHYQTETGGQVVQAGAEPTTKAVKNGQSPEVDYAVLQEFGTEDMPPSPFFWPAYRLLKKKFKSRRQRALTKAFKEISNGG
jgi:HK97 gp10 family phage protein